MRYRIQHTTTYRYDSPVSVAQQLVRLQPRNLPWQRCLAFALQATPAPESVLMEQDYFGNPMQSLGFAGAHMDLCLVAESVVEVDERPWANVALSDSPPWESVRRSLTGLEEGLAAEYRFSSPLVPLHEPIIEFAANCFTPEHPLLEACSEFMRCLFEYLEYMPGQTDAEASVADVWLGRQGVCQDYAQIMLSGLRGLGLAARYVSGYLRTQPPLGQVRLVGADASHAWVAVWCPRWGWVEFDPTNNQLANRDYIVLAWGRDFSDVSPVRGVITGSTHHELDVAVTVWPEEEYQQSLERETLSAD